MLTILHVINHLTLGGAETLLFRLVTRDRRNRHVVVSLGRPNWYSARLRDQGVRLHHLDIDTPLGIPKGFARLNRAIRESEADVVQCWMYRSNVFGGLAAKAAGKPVVWGIHSASIEPLRPVSRGLARVGGLLASSVPDYVINCSARSSEVHAGLGYSAAPGGVVHNGYDASIWYPDEGARASHRKLLGLSDREFAVGCIARWDPIKDVPNFLAAVRIAKESGAQLRCFLIGAGLKSDNRALRTAIRAARCGDVVVPLGPRSDMRQIARALDLHVLPSRTEAFPNVVAETMLSGTPNVVTDVGDAEVMVGSSGWVVPPRDPARLAEAIVDAYREWKKRPAIWTARREAARDRISGRFSYERMAAAYQDVWQSVAFG